MSSVSQTSFPTFTIVHTYLGAKDKNFDLSMKIEEGFGPNGLGILSVTDVPGYSSLRTDLFHLAPRLAGLPEKVKEELEDPHSRYNFGWSHGKEKLESGRPGIHHTVDQKYGPAMHYRNLKWLIPLNASLTFGEYSEMLIDKYYHPNK